MMEEMFVDRLTPVPKQPIQDLRKKRYSDTPQGAKEFVEDQTIFRTRKRTKYIPDILFPGVWKVSDLRVPGNRKSNATIILYMAGYEPLPNCHKRMTRETNDFEEVESES